MKEILEFFWDKIPWFIKWPVIVMFTPTILIFLFLSWHTKSVHGMIKPYSEKRDAQILAIEDRRNLEYGHIKESIADIKKQNETIYKYLINKRFEPKGKQDETH